jgi:hypothetical protein
MPGGGGNPPGGGGGIPAEAYVSRRQHTSAYASIRQHTPAYVSIRQHTSAYASRRQNVCAPQDVCQLTYHACRREALPLAICCAEDSYTSSLRPRILAAFSVCT